MDQYLSDWEEAETAIPWAVGDHGWVSKDSTAVMEVPEQSSESRSSMGPAADAGPDWASLMATEGVQPKIRILYVPEYMPSAQRLTLTSQLSLELSRFF